MALLRLPGCVLLLMFDRRVECTWVLCYAARVLTTFVTVPLRYRGQFWARAGVPARALRRWGRRWFEVEEQARNLSCAVLVDRDMPDGNPGHRGVTIISNDPAALRAGEPILVALLASDVRVPRRVVPVNTELVGALIGKMGAKIKSLEAEHGVAIKIDVELDSDYDSEDMEEEIDGGFAPKTLVVITGEHPASVSAAVRDIQQAACRGRPFIGSVVVDMVGRVIGPHRTTITSLQTKYSCEIEIGDTVNKKTRVTVTAKTQATLDGAMREIRLNACHYEPKVRRRLEIDRSYVGRIIGPGGSWVRQLKERFKCQIETRAFVPSDPTMTGVEVSGDDAVLVDNCVAEIIAIAAGQVRGSNAVKERVYIADSAVGRLIGVKGANISALRDACTVAIDIEKAPKPLYRAIAESSDDEGDDGGTVGARHRLLACVLIVGADAERVNNAKARIARAAGPLYQPRESVDEPKRPKAATLMDFLPAFGKDGIQAAVGEVNGDGVVSAGAGSALASPGASPARGVVEARRAPEAVVDLSTQSELTFVVRYNAGTVPVLCCPTARARCESGVGVWILHRLQGAANQLAFVETSHLLAPMARASS